MPNNSSGQAASPAPAPPARAVPRVEQEGGPEHGPEPRPSTSQTGQTFIELSEFKLSWNLIYQIEHQGLTAGEVIKKKEALKHKLKSKVAAVIVRQTKQVKNLTRETYVTIYNTLLMTKHPDSFIEVLASGAKSTGGFIHMLKYHFDNRKRPDRNRHLRQSDLIIRHYEQPRGKFAYSCVRWRIRESKPGQTELTIQQQIAQMIKDYQEVRPKSWDWANIEKMLDNTYKAQRDMVCANITAALEQQKKNLSKKRKRISAEDDDIDPDADLQEVATVTTISKIAVEWPFLFSYKGMLIHFKTLTDVDLELEFNKFDSGLKKQVLMEFLKNLDKREDKFYHETFKALEKAKKQKPEEDHELKAMIIMLGRYFKEGCCIVETTEVISAV